VSEVLSIDFNRSIPVFPLSDCVLLPHTFQPLQVFEARYIEMVRRTLDTDGLLALALFEGHVSQDDYLHGRPPLRPHVCVGYIRQYERLDDGRYLVVLQGICRARTVEEVPHDPYRLFRLRPLDLDSPPDDSLAPFRARVDELLKDRRLCRLKIVRGVRKQIAQAASSRTAIDMLAAALCGGIDERYAMLAQPDAAARAQWVLERLTALQARPADGT
jgi:Lon protease-like protein